MNRPSTRGRTRRTALQAPPFTCCSSRTRRRPRTKPASFSGRSARARRIGGSRLSTRTANHVERRPSVRRKSCAGILRTPDRLSTSTAAARPESVRSTTRSRTPGTLIVLDSSSGRRTSGPQPVVLREAVVRVRHGDEVRHGRGVRPDLVDGRRAPAGGRVVEGRRDSPCQSSTRPAVAAIARFVGIRSAWMPP